MRLRTYQELEERDHADDGTKVGNGSHTGTKLVGAAVELLVSIEHTRPIKTHARAKEERNEEEYNEQRHVEDNRTERNDGNAQETRLSLPVDAERLDEEVGNDEQDGEAEGAQNLRNNDGLPRSTGDITGELKVSNIHETDATHLLRWQTELLPLETSNSRTRQTAVTDPRVGVSPGVTSGHPAEELAVVNDEV